MRLSLTIALTLISSPALAATPHACLTEAIYFEAGSKGPAGRAAVGHTILNRVASQDFPNSICEVIAQGETEDACQFSYRCDGLAEVFQYPDQHARAKAAARRILSGQTPDPTNGALFFHSERIKSGWFTTRTRTGCFGGNIFYK